MSNRKEQQLKKKHYANQQFIDDLLKMWPCLRKENCQLMVFCTVYFSEFIVAIMKSFSVNNGLVCRFIQSKSYL